MTAKQYADLEAHIQRWADKHCVTDAWPNVWIGSRTVEFMATAARLVLDGIEDSREHERENT